MRTTRALAVLMLVSVLATAWACDSVGRDGSEEGPEEFLGWLRSHREHVGLASYEIGAEDDGIYHNADKLFPLGSTRKVLILGAYAVQVADEKLDPEQRVRIRDVERWYWPGTDAGAHERAVKDWQVRGRTDASNRVALDNIANAMIRWSDNAAADYILDRVGGPGAVAGFAKRSGMKAQQPLMPVLGEFLGWSIEDVDVWVAASARQRAQYANDLARAAKTDTLDELPQSSVDSQFELANTSPAGTPGEWAGLMSRLYEGKGLRAAARDVIRRHLEWPLAAFASNRRRFDRFGEKGGLLAGVITETMYAKPKRKRPVVIALFLRDVPRKRWESLIGSNVHQEFTLRFAEDAEFRIEVGKQLAG